jgi:hypothetical protein
MYLAIAATIGPGFYILIITHDHRTLNNLIFDSS